MSAPDVSGSPNPDNRTDRDELADILHAQHCGCLDDHVDRAADPQYHDMVDAIIDSGYFAKRDAAVASRALTDAADEFRSHMDVCQTTGAYNGGLAYAVDRLRARAAGGRA